ncbi:ATP-binding protein [Benzoatithermus flavus]|uniref:histidine kinase n=1 Tax=Benzoatithermus flavus TaxID=3108223 RepID=A0ABU8XMX1_9PROT
MRHSDNVHNVQGSRRVRAIGLRDRLILWLALIIGLLFVVDGAVLQLVVLPSFEQVENAEAERSFDRALNALNGELQELHANAADYATWDDSYAFAAGEENGYAETNGTPVSMGHLDLAVFAVLDRQGALRLGRLRHEDGVAPLPDALLPTLLELQRRFAHEGGEGIVSTAHGLWLASIQPILRSDGSGPPVGTLIMARWLDEKVRARLEERTQERIAFWRADGTLLPLQEAAALRELVQSGATHLLRVDEGDDVAVHGLLRDVADAPALLLRVDTPRSATRLGAEAVRTATLGLVVSAVVALLVLRLLLQHLVVSPLSILATHMLGIRRTGDLSRPLVLERDDEIGALARAFDDMRTRLHAAHRELRDVFDSVGDLFFALDREFRFIVVNRACLETWGMTEEQVIGRPILAVLPRLEGSECFEAMRRVFLSGRPQRIETFSPIMQCWVEFYATTRSDGRLTVHLQDITRRKEAERAKSAFLATMSHEIRTPLTAILGFADLLARSPLSPEQQKHLRIVRDTGKTLLTVVNDILDLSKLEAGKMSLERIPVDLPALLREALATVELLGAEKGLAFRAEIAADLPCRVRSDPVRLKQVVGNLLFNALKFTEKGGITLRARIVDRDDAQVRVRVEVEDTGIGVAPEHLPRLFTMFEQADQTTTRRFGGTGLGLAICKRLVETMGGTIGVVSRPGAGSTFWFELPLEPAAAEERPEPVRATADAPGTDRALRVLVVDDIATNRMLLSALLGGLGHAPAMAEDGIKAVEAATRERFDLILMDLHMPGMDGFMATQAIRSGGGPNATTPIVALSADVLPETARACRTAGMDGNLAKPIEAERLKEVLGMAAARSTDGAGSIAA